MQFSGKFDATSTIEMIARKKAQIQDAKTKTLSNIGAMQVKAAQDRIRSSKTDPNGRPWAPWSMATIKQRTREGNLNRGLLYRSGALIVSIKYKVERGTLSVWSDAPYARFLQFGTPKMRARAFLGFGTQINRIRQTLIEGLK